MARSNTGAACQGLPQFQFRIFTLLLHKDPVELTECRYKKSASSIL